MAKKSDAKPAPAPRARKKKERAPRQYRKVEGYTPERIYATPLGQEPPPPGPDEVPPDRAHINVYGYRVSRVLRAWRSRVLQIAVIEPALGRTLTEKDKSIAALDKQYLAALNELQERWRVFAQALFDAGYYRMHCSPIVGEKMLTSAKLCPPFGVKTSTFFNVCSLASVCPFCYGRRHIRDIFKHFEHWLYGAPLKTKGAKGLPLDEDPYHPRLRIDPDYVVLSCLATRHQKTELAIGKIELARIEKYASSELRAAIFQDKNVEITRTRAPVSASLVRVVPEKRAIRVEMGSVMVVPCAMAEFASRGASPFVKFVCRAVTKENLAYACAEAFAYPADLMTCNTPALAAILKGLSGAHMRGTYARRVRPGFALRFGDKE